MSVLDLNDIHIMYFQPCISDLKHISSLKLYKIGIHDLHETIGDLNKLHFECWFIWEITMPSGEDKWTEIS